MIHHIEDVHPTDDGHVSFDRPQHKNSDYNKMPVKQMFKSRHGLFKMWINNGVWLTEMNVTFIFIV